MPSPFPGFDPFLEAQGYWREFHTTFLTWISTRSATRPGRVRGPDRGATVARLRAG